jgi:hypothetical protein
VPVMLSGDPELESPPIAVPGLPAAASGIRPPPPTIGAEQGRRLIDIVEEWGLQSFPASDPPANW